MIEAQSTEVAILQGINAVSVFGAPGGVDDVLNKIRAQVRAHTPDISTRTGRDEIASLAYKVARSKTTLDEMGKSLVADLKAKTGAVDAERRRIRTELDALRDEARKPLTDFEEAEKKRLGEHEAALLEISGAGLLDPSADSESIGQKIAALQALPNRDWQEFSVRAADAVEIAKLRLGAALVGAKRREAEAAETERLRVEKLRQEQAEREAQIAKAAAESARLEAEARAQREARETRAREQAELERVEREKQDAIARAERAEADRLASEKRAEANRIAAEQKAERDRLAAVEAERRRVAKEKADADAEEAKRISDRNHQARVNNWAQDDIRTHVDIPEGAARSIVVAIARGLIRHVRIVY